MTGPAADGFAMPAEWEPHQLTLMSWPCSPDTYRGARRTGGSAIAAARAQQAAVADAIAAFEPVLMLVRPADAAAARRDLSDAITLLEADLDDAWIRDNGPVFVRNDRGEIALVDFSFNGWGAFAPAWSADDAVPALLAAHLGVRRYVSPIVLEGGSYSVDGAGTLITTEQCLLNPNRNPSLSRAGIEEAVGAALGVRRIIWLGEGHHEDYATDGHVDDICQFVAPGRVLLHAPTAADHPDLARGRDNLARLASARDAAGRPIEIVRLDTGTPDGIPYANVYLCNGGVIAPVSGDPEDESALLQLRAAYPGREVVPVRVDVLFRLGGGGPHCITQQVPAGTFVR